MEYFTAQEHAQVRYNIVDTAHLHILIKKDMPIPIDIYDADAKTHNLVINNEQQHEVKA
jgi:hypothetical protein